MFRAFTCDEACGKLFEGRILYGSPYTPKRQLCGEIPFLLASRLPPIAPPYGMFASPAGVAIHPILL